MHLNHPTSRDTKDQCDLSFSNYRHIFPLPTETNRYLTAESSISNLTAELCLAFLLDQLRVRL